MKPAHPSPFRAHSLVPIGTMRTCFAEKFGVPRQAGMVDEARGVLVLGPDPRYRAALAELERFSHPHCRDLARAGLEVAGGYQEVIASVFLREWFHSRHRS